MVVALQQMALICMSVCLTNYIGIGIGEYNCMAVFMT